MRQSDDRIDSSAQLCLSLLGCSLRHNGSFQATVFDKMEEHDNVGKHSWVEDNNWWKDHAPDIDVSSMTHEQKRILLDGARSIPMTKSV